MICFRETAIGRIAVREENGAITRVYLNADAAPRHEEEGETPLLRKAFQQIEEYLAGRRTRFSLPLRPEGTPFMKSVWLKLAEVPYGETASYKDIAVAVGNPKAVRAVGMANNRNPLPLFVPCHRIIGSDGSLVGYGGGLDLKKRLLDLEKSSRP